MSIYSSRYEPWEGQTEPAEGRFWVIAAHELTRLWREKWVRRLLIMAWVPVLFLAGRLYLELVMGEAFGEHSRPDDVFVMLFKAEAWFVALVLAAFGASMIARDVHSRALTLYFTRSLNVNQYLLGKMTAVLVVVLGLTLVPGLLLAACQLLMGSTLNLVHFVNVLGRVAVASVLGGVMVSSLILLLSAFGRSARYVGVAWLGAFVFLDIARSVLVNVLGPWPLLDAISIRHVFVGTAECLIRSDWDLLPSLLAAALLGPLFTYALRVRLVALREEQT